MDHGHVSATAATLQDHDPPELPPGPPPSHVIVIARLARWLGLLLIPAGTALAIYHDQVKSPPACGCAAAWAFAAFYGLSLWRSAADTLAQEPPHAGH